MDNGYRYQTTDTWKRFDLNESAHFTIYNNSTINTAVVSKDGVNILWNISPGIGYTFNDANLNVVYVKSKNAGNACVLDFGGHGDRKVIYSPRGQENISDSPAIPGGFVQSK